MSSTIITFAGNLTGDPVLKYIPEGTAVCEFAVAVNRRVKKDDQWQDAEPTFHNVKVWGKTAENVAESFVKGDRVLVHGTVETDAWEAEGEKRTRDYVIVSERHGEIGASLRYASARPQKTTRTKQDD